MLQGEATLIDERNGSKGTFNLEPHQLTVSAVHRNLPPSSLYEHAIRHERDSSIAENGALVAYSGVKTGRSPGDKRVVKHPDSERDVPTECPGVPRDILRPRGVWPDAAAYDATAKKLADLFRRNFTKYESGVSAEIRSAGPA